MASTILSPRPVDITPSASAEVSQLDQLCSGSLDAYLAVASREASNTSNQAPKTTAGAAKQQVCERRTCTSSIVDSFCMLWW